MKIIKNYSEFLNESNNNKDIINIMLDSLENRITEMVSGIETWFLKNFPDNTISDYDREVWRITITRDLIIAVEKYTKPTDTLIEIQSNRGRNGNIVISAKIQRDEELYNFSTEAIYAGGHNIQVRHFRYITKTKLPRTGNNTISKQYDAKFKKMSKLEKINKEIQSYTERIETSQKNININLQTSDEEIKEIIKKDSKLTPWPTWEEIIKRDAAKNYNNDEQYYYKKQEENIQNNINFWKTKNIKWKQDFVKDAIKTVARLQKKLDALL
jgi:hypothetical protein